MTAPTRTAAALLVTLAVVLSACGDGRGRVRDAGGMDGSSIPCTSDEECDDSISCTSDSCGVGGFCRFEPVDALCPMGQVCNPSGGCSDTPTCTVDSDCDDSIDCTLDSCGVGNMCRNMALNELCTAPDVCDPSMGGCVAGMGCTMDSDCDDSIDCTDDSCGADMTCRNTPIHARCAMGETCSPTVGCFMSMGCMTDEECQDGNFCNGREFCMPEFGCQPAPMPRVCDDTDDCTTDRCDTDTDMCVFECDPSRPECGCPVETPCDGTFNLSPAMGQMCACLIGCSVSYTLTTATFSCDGPLLQVRLASGTWTSSLLTQAPRPTDGTFDVSTVITGGCDEHYRLQGMFTGPDTFSATFSSDFVDSMGTGMCLDCAPDTWTVTGTRAP